LANATLWNLAALVASRSLFVGAACGMFAGSSSSLLTRHVLLIQSMSSSSGTPLRKRFMHLPHSLSLHLHAAPKSWSTRMSLLGGLRTRDRNALDRRHGIIITMLMLRWSLSLSLLLVDETLSTLCCFCLVLPFSDDAGRGSSVAWNLGLLASRERSGGAARHCFGRPFESSRNLPCGTSTRVARGGDQRVLILV
jgi:hypothetical protein